MRQPDDKLRDAIDVALDRLHAAGIIEKIYAKYGITLDALDNEAAKSEWDRL